ncbi:MarR family winged helix-turn-helix transcriptional regulator [Pelobacter propionicus]|uniref:Transcriptional regulator, MarR family n=1 Tax=Pelobacter propionicus (strain DSM 2379 / NBRC 103807 / OttBd1) TaxID=338966 RepID=A1AU44_PELPD|nr:MarR family transcriptional regulator [Pelobacter propionicus]ABL00865.1 transcriptional regulator, MarR family [Pelobacter propionicus DSM 2379]
MDDRKEVIGDIIDNLRRIYQAVSAYSKDVVRDTGLTAPQLWALKILKCESPLMVSVLARRMCLHPATVVGILDRLEAKELVTRVRSRQDRRVVELNLTESGEKILADAPEVAQSMLIKGLDTLSDEQRRCVREGMELVVRILAAEGIKPLPLQA